MCSETNTGICRRAEVINWLGLRFEMTFFENHAVVKWYMLALNSKHVGVYVVRFYQSKQSEQQCS
jgi:hypothetical protein